MPGFITSISLGSNRVDFVGIIAHALFMIHVSFGSSGADTIL